MPAFPLLRIITAAMSRSTKHKPPSLRESYERKMIVERIRRADELLIAESHAQLILEELDKDDLKKATKVLSKLSSIKAATDKDPQLKALGDAIKEAADEVNSFTGGGLGSLLKKGLGALTKKMGMKASANPLVKSLTLLNALETAFSQFSDVVKNNIPEYDAAGGSILEQAPDEKVKKNISKALTKAFRPGGFFAKLKSLFGSGGGMPYVKDVSSIVKGVMSVKGEVLQGVVKAATAGGMTTDEASEAVQDIAQQGSSGQQPGTQAGKGSPKPVKGTDDLATSIAAAEASKNKQDATEAAAEAKENPKKFTASFIKDIAQRANKDEAIVSKVVSALVKTGHLKSTVSITTESRTAKRNSSQYTLTASDAVRARELYLESGCSSKRWVGMLLEVDAKEAWKDLEPKLRSGEIAKDGIVSFLKSKKIEGNAVKDFTRKYKDNIVGALRQGEKAKSQTPPSNEGPAPEVEQDLATAASEAKALKDKKDLDQKQAKEHIEALGDEIKSLAGLFKTIRSQNINKGIDIPEVTDKLNDQFEEARSKIQELLGSDEITPIAASDATLLLLRVQKSYSSYLAQVKYRAKKDEDQKLAAENEKKLKELESQLADTKASLEKLASEKKAGEEASNERLKKLASSLSKDLADVDPVDIIAILDALPKYLVAESRRRRILESR